MSISVEEILSRLSDSGLLSADEITAVDRSLNAGQIVESLFKQGKITSHQAKILSSGKADPLVLGDYVILEKIGEGGMGQVFKAEHRRMKRFVALKVLPREVTKDENAVKRFEREVQAAAKLHHPNVAVAYDAGEHNETHYLISEYLDGTDLSALVKQSGPCSIEQAVDCVVQAAKGLEYAHAKGVIHRDIKPSNLLLDTEGTVKILDMGLARFENTGDATTQAELTGTGAVMGTIDYMSPEQALDTKHADARSDIYSLGCTLYYLLTGKPVFAGDSLMKKLLAHREESIPPLKDVRPEVPEELDAVYRMMVEKQPDQRFQSMGEVLSALTSLSGVQTVFDESVGAKVRTACNANEDILPSSF